MFARSDYRKYHDPKSSPTCIQFSKDVFLQERMKPETDCRVLRKVGTIHRLDMVVCGREGRHNQWGRRGCAARQV